MCNPTVIACLLAFSFLMDLGSMARSSVGMTPPITQGAPSENDQGSGTVEQESESSNQGSDTEDMEVDEAFERFSQAMQELQQNRQRINNLVVSMPIGFTDKVNVQKSQIAALKQRNELLKQQLMPNAVESFEKFPGRQEPVNNYLMQHVQSQLTGQRFPEITFDPFAARESYQRLVDAGIENPSISMFGYRIHYLLNDFESARLKVLEAAQRGYAGGQPVMNDLRTVTGHWHRELAFRKADETANLPRVKMELDVGDLVIELFEDQAPNTVANFISLVESGFYDKLTFNQVSISEVAIAGSPTDDGKGGPGYAIKDECDGENIRHHFTGVISMYPQRKNGGGSRFLITKQPRPALVGKVTAFGRVIEGLENLYKIQVVDRTRGVLPNSKLPTVINKMTVLRKRDHEYKPEKITETTPSGLGR